ncbi:MAG TPA: tetratricopeptide repeat protein [Candidatus Sumerlaeota bacterium]|nr:tetratricopeptide repeat protein [Candidatus Sumerlaeota bacterium]
MKCSNQRVFEPGSAGWLWARTLMVAGSIVFAACGLVRGAQAPVSSPQSAPVPFQAAAITEDQRQALEQCERRDQGYPFDLPYPVNIVDQPFSPEMESRRALFACSGQVAFYAKKGEFDKALALLNTLPQDRSKWPVGLRLSEARILLRQTQIDQARERCQAVLAAAPDSIEAYLLLAEVENLKRNPQGVVDTLEKAREKAPLNRMVLEMLARRYQLRLQQKDLKTDEVAALLSKVESVYENIIQAAPGQPSLPYLRILINIKKTRGDLQKACAYQEQLVQIMPHETQARLDLAEMLQKLNRGDEAFETLRRGVLLDPEDSLLTVAVIRSLSPAQDEAMDRMRNPKVLDFYRQLAVEYPGRADLQVRYARMLLMNDQTDEAARILQSAQEQHPGTPEVWLTLARLYQQQKQPEKVRSAMEAYVALAPRNPETLTNAARLLLDFDQPEPAAGYLSTLREVKPDAPELGALETELLIQQKNFPEAAVRLRQQCDAAPEKFENYPKYIRVLEELNRTQDAIEPLRNALGKISDEKLGLLASLYVSLCKRHNRAGEVTATLEPLVTKYPEDAKLSLLLIEFYTQNGEKDKARALLDKLLAANEGDAETLYLIGLRLMDLDQSADAEACLRKVVTLLPDSWQMRVVLAGFYQETNQPQKLTEVVNDLAKSFPNDPKALYNVAMLRWDLNQFDEAQRDLERTLQMNPGDAEACNSLGYLYCERDIRYDEALKLVQKAMELKPGEYHILDSLGWVYYKQGDYAKAITTLEEVARQKQNDATVQEHLAYSYLKAGRSTEALARFKLAVELLKESKEDKDRKKLEQLSGQIAIMEKDLTAQK